MGSFQNFYNALQKTIHPVLPDRYLDQFVPTPGVSASVGDVFGTPEVGLATGPLFTSSPTPFTSAPLGATVMYEDLMPLSTGPEFNIAGLIGQGLGIVQNLTAPSQQSSLEKALETLTGPILTQLGAGQINTGLTRAQGPGRCNVNKRRLKIQMGADGQPHVVAVCPPRRMNPLNPRALGRAARRLGSFQRIASHIEKTIQKACRTKTRRSSRGPSCAPSRCR